MIECFSCSSVNEAHIVQGRQTWCNLACEKIRALSQSLVNAEFCTNYVSRKLFGNLAQYVLCTFGARPHKVSNRAWAYVHVQRMEHVTLRKRGLTEISEHGIGVFLNPLSLPKYLYEVVDFNLVRGFQWLKYRNINILL